MVEPSADSPADGPESDEQDDAAEPSGVAVERRAAQVSAALHGQRLDRALVAMAPEFSRNHLQSLIEHGHVAIDAQIETTPARRVRAGQRIQVALEPTAETRAFRAEPMALDFVHEDDDVLVVNKPAGLVVHPAAGNWSGTLLNGLLAHVKGAAALPRAGIVHRLDKDTSGLLVVGKTLACVTALTRAIAAREVHREYLAIAHGELVQDVLEVDDPIGRDPASRVRMAVVRSGKPALTDIRCLARRGGYSLLGCRLHTGRTHQIRVHLASRGHPLVADPTYGGRPALGMRRQALHAVRLAFAHPSSDRTVSFEAPPPADFAAALEAMMGTSATR
jgi:23S rRNA pseudouridine1911/1915/1917 synthase